MAASVMNKAMISFGARKGSFESTSRSKPTKVSKWPHPLSFLATPETLASAGFYYMGTGKDTVKCFLCGKELTEWEPADEPAKIHAEKCPNCPWAILQCISDRDEKEKIVFTSSRLPCSEAMYQARLATFVYGEQTLWPHEAKNRGPSSKAMAAAGFMYMPAKAKDDTCACLYCDVELSGWEPDDDPVEEHRRRRSQCPFFTSPRNKEIAETVRAPAKSKRKPSNSNKEVSTKGTKSSSRPTRAATRQNKAAKPNDESSKQEESTLLNQDVVMEYDVPTAIENDEPRKKRTKSTQSKSSSRHTSSSRSRSRSRAQSEVTESTSAPSASSVVNSPNPLDDDAPQASEDRTKSSRRRTKGATAKPKSNRSRSRASGKKASIAESLENTTSHQSNHLQMGEAEKAEEEQELDFQAERLMSLKEKTFSSTSFHHDTAKQNLPKNNEPPSVNQHGELDTTNGRPYPLSNGSYHENPLSPTIESPLLSQISGYQLTDVERAMTVETWIRNEIEREYERLKADGRSRINEFVAKATEVARQIEGL